MILVSKKETWFIKNKHQLVMLGVNVNVTKSNVNQRTLTSLEIFAFQFYFQGQLFQLYPINKNIIVLEVEEFISPHT